MIKYPGKNVVRRNADKSLRKLIRGTFFHSKYTKFSSKDGEKTIKNNEKNNNMRGINFIIVWLNKNFEESLLESKYL